MKSYAGAAQGGQQALTIRIAMPQTGFNEGRIPLQVFRKSKT